MEDPTTDQNESTGKDDVSQPNESASSEPSSESSTEQDAASQPSTPPPTAPASSGQKSDKNFMTTLLLSIFLGGLGGHRFYVGKIGTGIAMLLTLGGLGVWYIIDFVMIVTGKFTDSNGLPIKS